MKKNNWYVITGGPCAGKTTLVAEFEKKGYRVVYEVAREYIEEELAKGKTIEALRKDEAEFQKQVLKRKIALEKSLDPIELTLFDRGIPDTSAYYELIGIEKDELLDSALQNSLYQKVFLLELLDYKKDSARIESEEEAKKIGALLHKSYHEIGSEIVNVPKMPLAQRVAFIVERIGHE